MSFFNINQHITIQGRECEVVIIDTQKNGGRIYKAKALFTNDEFEIIQLKNGEIKSIKKAK